MIHPTHLREVLAAAATVPRRAATFDAGVHALVVLVVVLCATILQATGHLDRTTVGNIYAGAIGYAAGRSGSSGGVRSTDIATSDETPPAGR